MEINLSRNNLVEHLPWNPVSKHRHQVLLHFSSSCRHPVHTKWSGDLRQTSEGDGGTCGGSPALARAGLHSPVVAGLSSPLAGGAIAGCQGEWGHTSAGTQSEATSSGGPTGFGDPNPISPLLQASETELHSRFLTFRLLVSRAGVSNATAPWDAPVASGVECPRYCKSAAVRLPRERKSQASARDAERGARRPPPLPLREPAGVRRPRPAFPRSRVRPPGAAPSLRTRRALFAARTAARAAARPPPWAGLSQNSPAPGERPRAPPRAAGRPMGGRGAAWGGPAPGRGQRGEGGVREADPAAAPAWPRRRRRGPSLAQAQVGTEENAAGSRGSGEGGHAVPLRLREISSHTYPPGTGPASQGNCGSCRVNHLTNVSLVYGITRSLIRFVTHSFNKYLLRTTMCPVHWLWRE